MADPAEIRRELRRYLVAELLPGEREENVGDELPLRTGGLIDSVGTLKLVGFVERRFGIEITSHEAGVGTFDTIADIAALVAAKTARRS
jgi:acyl carrier protein